MLGSSWEPNREPRKEQGSWSQQRLNRKGGERNVPILCDPPIKCACALNHVLEADVELEDTKEAIFNRYLCLKGIWFMFFIFTENPGDPHKILKLQCTGLLKMTLKWAYFIMLNNTIFRCGSE